jgi:hypothetical protein
VSTRNGDVNTHNGDVNTRNGDVNTHNGNVWSSLRGAQRRSNPEIHDFPDCFVAPLLTMTLFASDMLRDLRITPKVLNMNNPEQAVGAARGTVTSSSELRSSSTPSELRRGRCYPRAALRLFGVIHIEVLRTFDRRHYAFSFGTKRVFAMTTRRGLLRRISNSQNYTARGIKASLQTCSEAKFGF